MVRHPNLWYVIRRMKTEGEITRHKVTQAQRGDPVPRRRVKWRRLERRIQRLKRDLTRNRRTLNNYWNAVMYATKTFG